MTAPATPAPAAVTRWAVKCGKCAVEQHANGRCPDACPICGAVFPAWPKPTTPAPADGAPGERVSDFPGVWTTHPMTREGAVNLMGQFWHAVEGATIRYLPGEQPTAEEIAKSEEAGRIAKEIERHVIAMLSMPFAPAAPLPAPSASAGVGAETLAEWRKLADGLQRDASSDDGPAEARAWRAACAIRAACDALSTAAAPVRALTDAEARALVDEMIDARDERAATKWKGRAYFDADARFIAARARLIAALTGGAS